MKTLVIYCSHAGNTKKYAEDIASAVEGDILPIKKLKSKTLTDYDNIVFGGWLLNNEIKGLNDFLCLWDDMEGKNVIVFSSGMSIPTKESRQQIISANLLDNYHLRYYQLRGSFDMSKLKFPYSLLMKSTMRTIERDPNATADQRALLSLRNEPLDFYDVQGIEKIIKVLESLNVIEAEVVDK